MANGSTAMLRRVAQDCLCQATAEHFQQCAEFALLRNRGLGALAVTVFAHSASRRAAQFSMRGDVTLVPFLGGHRLVLRLGRSEFEREMPRYLSHL